MIKAKNAISFYTFGCRLNQAETAILQNSLDEAGYRVVDFKQPADVVVINTCTVTENGDSDTRRLVNRVNRAQPDAKIALIGCQAQIQKRQLAQLNNVRWIIGNARKMQLADILSENQAPEKPLVITPAMTKETFTMPTAGIDRKHTRANLKIQDGCDFFCSFCEIPYARGRARSRQFEDIVKEARTLVAGGHKELVITGINVGTYREKGRRILDVINALEDIDGLDRIRISSIEPTTIPEELINKMASKSKLCRYLHIPLQSASDKVLRLMKRKYRADAFFDFIENAAARIPQVCIGTDVIVGFPGENDNDFEATYHRLLDAPVHYFHVFSYSHRQMAKARALPQPVDVTNIQKRSQRLRELSRRKRHVYFDSLIGTRQHVLFEQKKKGAWTGLTDHYVRVNTFSDKSLNNRFCPVTIKERDGDLLIGEITHA